ncbi:TetR/AcrR family transcriptional regulator [Variovorax sp. Root411]|uniref:TetR/AcrR family transcriptional regulator n=1 Tax=Variovorax sp. Root411 TaxID=1736530 RepID=UPI0009E755DD|nr:TetR/AcrR family transcriptional regulator C-terminal domain-containing protein [Variovorax sp. Root411]
MKAPVTERALPPLKRTKVKPGEPVTPEAVIVPRRRGRPRKEETADACVTPLISREDIIEKAVELTKSEPLSDLSIVSLARHFGVTTALIHYYAGSRDELISGVINRYFMERVEKLRPLTRKNWRSNVEDHAYAIFDVMLQYGGVLRYLMSHNRFRLFQQVGAGETDYGMVYLNRIAEIFRSGGFNAEKCALGYHLLIQYVMTSAYAEVNRQLPGDHGDYILGKIRETSKEQFPAAHFFASAFSKLDSRTAFNAGLKILLDGMERWPRSSAGHK